MKLIPIMIGVPVVPVTHPLPLNVLNEFEIVTNAPLIPISLAGIEESETEAGGLDYCVFIIQVERKENHHSN